MIALRIEFLAGRFHANPWDNGTNDGAVEWPPSPWRLLRAITAGWYRSGAGDRETFLRVLDALAEPPRFLLPRATSGHSRHYVPLGGMKNGRPEKTQILDSFLALERDRDHAAIAHVIWPAVQLSIEERSVLKTACRLVGYLGRAESWCSIEITEQVSIESQVDEVNLASRADGSGPVVRRLSAGPSLRGSGLLRSLAEPTAEMRRARRLVPEGTAWVEYRLPKDFLLVREQVADRAANNAVFGPLVLRFAVERPSQGILPSITSAIDVADLMRRAVLTRYSRLEGAPASKLLAGKSDDETGKREGHDHPYYLPFDSRADGKIDRIDVWFPKGCTHEEYRSVSSVDALVNSHVLESPLPLTFWGNVLQSTTTAWRSTTPIVLDRFPRTRGGSAARTADAPVEQLRVMVERRYGVAADIELWAPGSHVRRSGGVGPRIDAFRQRRRGKDERLPPVVGATLHFAQPVSGPVVLGRMAHFGLGQFEPLEATAAV